MFEQVKKKAGRGEADSQLLFTRNGALNIVAELFSGDATRVVARAQLYLLIFLKPSFEGFLSPLSFPALPSCLYEFLSDLWFFRNPF